MKEGLWWRAIAFMCSQRIFNLRRGFCWWWGHACSKWHKHIRGDNSWTTCSLNSQRKSCRCIRTLKTSLVNSQILFCVSGCDATHTHMWPAVSRCLLFICPWSLNLQSHKRLKSSFKGPSIPLGFGEETGGTCFTYLMPEAIKLLIKKQKTKQPPHHTHRRLGFFLSVK